MGTGSRNRVTGSRIRCLHELVEATIYTCNINSACRPRAGGGQRFPQPPGHVEPDKSEKQLFGASRYKRKNSPWERSQERDRSN